MATGPSVAELSHRLIDTPAEFLAEPSAVGGPLAVEALVSDLLVAAGGAGLDRRAAEMFGSAAGEARRNWQRCVAVAVWLLADPELLEATDAAQIDVLLRGGLEPLAAHVAAPELVSDPDRREELVRRCLADLGLVPEGETAAQAADRLTSLDSAERVRVLAETQAAEARAAEVRAAMHAQAAAEAAAKASRE